jgi:hypothetical protein
MKNYKERLKQWEKDAEEMRSRREGTLNEMEKYNEIVARVEAKLNQEEARDGDTDERIQALRAEYELIKAAGEEITPIALDTVRIIDEFFERGPPKPPLPSKYIPAKHKYMDKIIAYKWSIHESLTKAINNLQSDGNRKTEKSKKKLKKQLEWLESSIRKLEKDCALEKKLDFEALERERKGEEIWK